MLVGVGLFGVINGFLANKFLPQTSKPEPETVDPTTMQDIQRELREIKELLRENTHKQ